MLQLLNIICAEDLKAGDRVRVSKGDGASFLTVTHVEKQERGGVMVGYGGPNGYGVSVLYPCHEEVATVAFVPEPEVAKR